MAPVIASSLTEPPVYGGALGAEAIGLITLPVPVGKTAVALALALLGGICSVIVKPPAPFLSSKILAAITASAYVKPIGCALGWYGKTLPSTTLTFLVP